MTDADKQPRPSGRRLWPWLAAWTLLAGLQIVQPHWYCTPDSCNYLSMARSVAHHGLPTRLGSANWVFGIGYPVLVSPVFWVSELPFVWLTLVHAGWAAVYLAGTWVWARRHADSAAVPIALLAVGNVVVLSLFRRPLSEVAFFAVMIWSVNAVAGLRPGGRAVGGTLLSAAVLLCLLVLIRPTGILFALGAGLQLAVMAGRGEMGWGRAAGLSAALTAPAALVLAGVIQHGRLAVQAEAGWDNWSVFAKSDNMPATDLGDLAPPAAWAEGLRWRISEVGRLLLPGLFNSYGRTGQWLDINMLLYLPLLALVVFGWWRLARGQPDAYVLTLPAYFVLHVFWPFNQSGRFFAPLVPLLFLCVWFALPALGRWRPRLMYGLVAAHLLVALGHWWFIDRPRALRDDQSLAELSRLLEPLQDDRGLVQVAPGVANADLLVQFVLDRPVRHDPPATGVAPEVRWLVQDAGQAVPAGFWPWACSERFQVLRRVEQDPKSGMRPGAPATLRPGDSTGKEESIDHAVPQEPARAVCR
jgi:hypothetical protein